MKLKKAIKILAKNLKKDKEYYYGWQSNIAMSFFDAYYYYKNHEKYLSSLNRDDIKTISNNAAKHFLSLLIKTKTK